MQIDLVQLRTFVAVAEEQHLTRAADRLHMSQSAASGHIRAVEENLDVQLFLRANRGLQLTRAGELLLREAQTLLNQAGLFTSFARQLRGKMEGNLVVGTNSEPGTRIGDVVTALHLKHPLVSVELHGRPSSGTRQGLKSGELDIGVLLGRPIDAGFTYYELTTVKFRVVGPAQWKAQIEAADWAGLASLPWISATGSSAYASMLAGLFDEKGLKLNTIVSFDNAALARAMVQTGIGMMLVRHEQAVQGERDGYLAISPIAHAEFSLSVAHLSSRKDDPLIGAFVEAAKVAWPDMKLSESSVRR